VLPPGEWEGGIRQHRAGKPVFVDRTGRRRRVVIVTGAAVGILIVVALVMLITGLTGSSPLHVPGFPDRPGEVPVAAPTTTPEPSASETPQPDLAPNAGSVSATPTRTSNRHVPTQTPSRDKSPKP
jgi:hypothetical protein